MDEATKNFIESFNKSMGDIFMDSFKKCGQKMDQPISHFLKPMPAIERLKVLINSYDYDWLAWEAPETLWMQIGKDATIPDFMENEDYRPIKDQIMALKTAILTDGPWVDHDIFEKVGNAICGSETMFDASQPLSPGQCYYTVRVLRKIRPSEEFDIDITKYIAVSFHQEGYAILPSDLSFCSNALVTLQRDFGEHDKGFIEALHKKWGTEKNKAIIPNIEKESAIDYQIARLRQLEIYVKLKEGGKDAIS